MSVNYKLFKELKTAGFQEPQGRATEVEIDGDWYSIPTIESIIEDLGEDFVVLKKLENGWYAASDKTDFPHGNRIEVRGWSTPIEAMMHLWLAVKEK